MIRHGDRVASIGYGNRKGEGIADAVDPVSTRGASNPWMVRTMAPLFEVSEQMSAPMEWATSSTTYLMGGNGVGVTSTSAIRPACDSEDRSCH